MLLLTASRRLLCQLVRGPEPLEAAFAVAFEALQETEQGMAHGELRIGLDAGDERSDGDEVLAE
jgi:hypothetical protein